MNDLFDDPKQLIGEAKGYMPFIEEAIGNFVHSKNWTVVVENDPHTREHLWKVAFDAPIDKRIKIRIFDVAGYLRSALDQACYASAVAIKGGEPSKTKFLFADTEKGIGDEIRKGKCKDMHPDLIDLITGLKPYQAGNRPLWALNKIRNNNVHRLLEPAAAVAGGFGLDVGYISGRMATCSEWAPFRRRLTFARLSPDSHFNAKIEPTIHVGFNPVLGFPDESVDHSLSKLINEVEGIVMSIEAETARVLG